MQSPPRNKLLIIESGYDGTDSLFIGEVVICSPPHCVPSQSFATPLQREDELHLRLLLESTGVGVAEDEVGLGSLRAGVAEGEIPVRNTILHNHAPTKGARRRQFIVDGRDMLLLLSLEVLD